MKTSKVGTLLAVGVLALSVAGCGNKAKSNVKNGEINQTMDLESNKKNFLYVLQSIIVSLILIIIQQPVYAP